MADKTLEGIAKYIWICACYNEIERLYREMLEDTGRYEGWNLENITDGKDEFIDKLREEADQDEYLELVTADGKNERFYERNVPLFW